MKLVIGRESAIRRAGWDGGREKKVKKKGKSLGPKLGRLRSLRKMQRWASIVPSVRWGMELNLLLPFKFSHELPVPLDIAVTLTT